MTIEGKEENIAEKPHQRRVRYKGTHPRSYKEKYKELNPEKYGEDVEKVIKKGRTPAGMHISICVKEILELLRIQPGEKGFDATLGYGGHTLEMLKQLNGTGVIYATDVDPLELPKTQERLEKLGYGPERLQLRLLNFAKIDQVVAEAGKFDFILADLGVSSMQIDNPDRGFSFKTDGPLDLRLNPSYGKTAASRLKKVSYPELVGMLQENADEPFAEEIARGILKVRNSGVEITTTGQLQQIITETLTGIPKMKKEDIKKSCQRCFQALRIDINREFDVLDEFLEKLPDALAPGGRVAILTFHSGEDRRVKKSFKYFFREGLYQDIAPDPIRPSAEECFANSRAKSAKLRWAIRA